MMDLKEIIKWFIPCFHILRLKNKKIDSLLTLIFLFLFFNSCSGMTAKVNSEVGLSENIESDKTFNLTSVFNDVNLNQSEIFTNNSLVNEIPRSIGDTSVGRTFGPRFKKMMMALLPVVFQMGAASTWAMVATLVGIKTFFLTLVILKLLLVAGAAKIGALFASKGHHQSHGWESPPIQQKEIHLHIHNGHQEHGDLHEEHVPISTWSREGNAASPEVKNINIVYDPYRGGPQTISTPYGNYVKVEPASTLALAT